MEGKIIDNQAVKEELINFVLTKTKEHKLSGYQLSKLSDLSHVGIDKILDGRTKNPSIRNLEKLKDAISTFENQQQSPVTLISLNEKLDTLISYVKELNHKIDILALDQELLEQIQKNLPIRKS